MNCYNVNLSPAQTPGYLPAGEMLALGARPPRHLASPPRVALQTARCAATRPCRSKTPRSAPPRCFPPPPPQSPRCFSQRRATPTNPSRRPPAARPCWRSEVSEPPLRPARPPRPRNTHTHVFRHNKELLAQRLVVPAKAHAPPRHGLGLFAKQMIEREKRERESKTKRLDPTHARTLANVTTTFSSLASTEHALVSKAPSKLLPCRQPRRCQS